MHYVETTVYLCVPAIKAAESKQNFITGIKNVVHKVGDLSLLFYSESLLVGRFSRNGFDNSLLTGIILFCFEKAATFYKSLEKFLIRSLRIK